jgi:hypothetical protein
MRIWGAVAAVLLLTAAQAGALEPRRKGQLTRTGVVNSAEGGVLVLAVAEKGATVEMSFTLPTDAAAQPSLSRGQAVVVRYVKRGGKNQAVEVRPASEAPGAPVRGGAE